MWNAGEKKLEKTLVTNTKEMDPKVLGKEEDDITSIDWSVGESKRV